MTHRHPGSVAVLFVFLSLPYFAENAKAADELEKRIYAECSPRRAMGRGAPVHGQKPEKSRKFDEFQDKVVRRLIARLEDTNEKLVEAKGCFSSRGPECKEAVGLLKASMLSSQKIKKSAELAKTLRVGDIYSNKFSECNSESTDEKCKWFDSYARTLQRDGGIKINAASSCEDVSAVLRAQGTQLRRRTNQQYERASAAVDNSNPLLKGIGTDEKITDEVVKQAIDRQIAHNKAVIGRVKKMGTNGSIYHNARASFMNYTPIIAEMMDEFRANGGEEYQKACKQFVAASDAKGRGDAAMLAGTVAFSAGCGALSAPIAGTGVGAVPTARIVQGCYTLVTGAFEAPSVMGVMTDKKGAVINHDFDEQDPQSGPHKRVVTKDHEDGIMFGAAVNMGAISAFALQAVWKAKQLEKARYLGFKPPEHGANLLPAEAKVFHRANVMCRDNKKCLEHLESMASELGFVARKKTASSAAKVKSGAEPQSDEGTAAAKMQECFNRSAVATTNGSVSAAQ